MLDAYAGGGGSGFSASAADSSRTGGSKGCAAGGAGTVYVGSSRSRSLIIDNGLPLRLSAPTPLPTQFPGGGGGGSVTGPLPLYDNMWVRRGALAQLPRAQNASGFTLSEIRELLRCCLMRMHALR